MLGPVCAMMPSPSLRTHMEQALSTDSQGTEPATNSDSELAALSAAIPYGQLGPVREVRPFTILGGKNDPTLDFRPLPDSPTEEDNESDPKDSSAPGSAGWLSSPEFVTVELPSESSASQEETASAEKDSGKPKESAKSGTPTS